MAVATALLVGVAAVDAGAAERAVASYASDGFTGQAVVSEAGSAWVAGSYRGQGARLVRIDDHVRWVANWTGADESSFRGLARDPARHRLYATGHTGTSDGSTSNTLLAAYDDRTGKLLWSQRGPAAPTFLDGGVRVHVTPSGTVMDVQSRSTTNSAAGNQQYRPYVVARTPEGRQLWQWHEPGSGEQHHIADSLLIGSTLLLAGNTWNPSTSLDSYLVALNTRTGRQLWSRSRTDGTADWSALAAAGSDVLVAGSWQRTGDYGVTNDITGVVQRLDPRTGAVRWTSTVATAGEHLIVEDIALDGSTVAVGGLRQANSRTDYAQKGWLGTLDPRTGARTWYDATVPGRVQQVALHLGVLYSTDRQQVHNLQGTAAPQSVPYLTQETVQLTLTARRATDHGTLWSSTTTGLNGGDDTSSTIALEPGLFVSTHAPAYNETRTDVTRWTP